MLGLNFIQRCPVCNSEDVHFGQAVFSPFFAARAFAIEPVTIGKNEFRDLDQGKSYVPAGTLFCRSCGSMASSARPNQDSMLRYYSGYQDDQFIEMRIHFEPSFQERFLNRSSPNTLRKHGERVSYVQKLEDYFQGLSQKLPNRILDIGGGSGANTPFSQIAEVEILEIDDEPDLGEGAHQRQYDLVTVLNVLEHVTTPEQILLKAKACCKLESGHVLVEVPLEEILINVMDEEATCQNKKIWTEHLNFFSEKGLEACLKRAGLDLVAPIEVMEISDGIYPNIDKRVIMLALAK